jgi:hypothetical protein
MSRRSLTALATLAAVVLLVSAPATAQTPPSGAKSASYKQPRTSWGDPDMQGIWNNVTATPLERSKELADKAFLSEQEAKEFEARQAKRLAEIESRPHTGYAASVWFETSGELSQNRTALLVDPENGRLPDLTPEGQKIASELTASAKTSPADTPEDRGPYERCITRGLPGSMMPGFYNHNYHIMQTPGYVAIVVEMIHDARIIPMDGRPHIGGEIKQWLGNSRGRWEGNTLVVETRGLRRIDQHHAGAFGTSEQGKVIERFTRLGPNEMDYRVTVEDAPTWAKTWTASIPMTKVEGPLYEYACHEGNYGLPNILAGHRREEREAASAATPQR